MPNIYKFNIGNDFISKATRAIEVFITEQDYESIRIALSGGESPRTVYEKLAKSKVIDWSKVELFQVDERYISEISEYSNAKIIRDSLSSGLPNLKAFYTFNTSLDIKKALAIYEDKLKKLDRPLFDLVLLGLGTDGHTASLFPHGPELEEAEKLVVHSNAPTGIKDRLSLTFPAIMSSRKIIFLIRGANKKEIIRKWLNDDFSEEEIPAKVILDHPDVDIFYDYSHK